MTDPNNSLGDPQIDLLAAYLDSPDLGDGVMTLPELDGFLAGLAAGPREIPVEEWLALVWGDTPPDFADDNQAATILAAIMAHHDAIAAQIASGDYAPILWIGEDGKPAPEGWAVGFMTAAGLREDAWRPLLESEDDDYLVYPIIAFCQDEAGQPLLDLSVRDREALRTEAPDQLAGAVLDIAEHWGRRAKSPPPQPIVRDGPKIGRNDPCPCGSGKKHKKCCGARPQ